MKKKQIAGMILAGIVSAGTIISSTFAGDVYAATQITIKVPKGGTYSEEYEYLCLEAGESYSLLNELDDNNISKNLRWSFSDEEIVDVDANGTVTGRKPGFTFVDCENMENGDYVHLPSVMVYFNDVKNQESTFFKPIYWAFHSGTTTGFDDGTFRQDDICTRGQIVTFIDRATRESSLYYLVPRVYLGIEESYSLLNEYHHYFGIGENEINDIKERGIWDISYSVDAYNHESDKIVTLDANGTVTGKNLGDAVVLVSYGQSEEFFDIIVRKSFDDVKNRDSAFFNPIYWAASEGITTGFEDNTFRQDDPCTRGQIVTFIWRAAGRPEPKSKDTKLTDLNEKSVFYKAILWASENGITTGFEDNTFRADDTCTRGQAVTFLYRALDLHLLDIYQRDDYAIGI